MHNDSFPPVAPVRCGALVSEEPIEKAESLAMR